MVLSHLQNIVFFFYIYIYFLHFTQHFNFFLEVGLYNAHLCIFSLQSQAYEFQFGLEYAWTMCIFAVSMTYSITCPIITPFGERHAATLVWSHNLGFCAKSLPVAHVRVPFPLTRWPQPPLSAACQSDADCVNMQTLRLWIASQTPTLLLSLPKAHQVSVYFCRLIGRPSCTHTPKNSSSTRISAVLLSVVWLFMNKETCLNRYWKALVCVQLYFKVTTKIVIFCRIWKSAIF